MTDANVDYYYYWLLERELFSMRELELVTYMLGYNIDTLNDAVYCRYGYRTVDDLKREVEGEWTD
jgi:hypothetical protein